MVLCQVQEIPKSPEVFKARRVKVGRFLADTAAQVNIVSPEILDLLDITGEKRSLLISSKVKINGVGGGVDGSVKELRVKLYSLKTRSTMNMVFYVGDHFPLIC